jgi:hypothetical protein
MLALLLDPRFKSLCLVSSFVRQEEGVNIVDEYDRRTLYPMLLKYYHHLHPMIKSIRCVDQTCDEDSSLDIFQQTTFISEPSKELVSRELLIRVLPSASQRHQMSSSMVGKT